MYQSCQKYIKLDTEFVLQKSCHDFPCSASEKVAYLLLSKTNHNGSNFFFLICNLPSLVETFSSHHNFNHMMFFSFRTTANSVFPQNYNDFKDLPTHKTCVITNSVFIISNISLIFYFFFQNSLET